MAILNTVIIYDVPGLLKTASGSVIAVSDALAKAVKSLDVDINAVQNLNGYSKPWAGGAGKNLLSPFIKGVRIDATTGAIGSASTYASTDKIYVDFSQHTNYYLSGMLTTLRNFVAAYNSSDQFLGRTGATTNAKQQLTASSFNGGTPQGTGDIAYIRVSVYEHITTTGVIDDIDNMTAQLEIGSSVTTYEPYANICPISGWNAVKVTRCGKNLFNKDDSNSIVAGYIASSAFSTNNSKARTIYVPISPSTTYTVSKNAGARFQVATSPNAPADGVEFTAKQNNPSGTSITITSGASDAYLWAWVYLEDTDTGTLEDMLATVQIELGSTATAYEPYNGNTYTIQLGQTVYGGSLDVTTGMLTVTHGFITLVGGNEATYSNNGHTNYSTRCIVTISGKANGVDNMTSNRFAYTNSGDYYGRMLGRAVSNNVEFYLPPSVSTNVADQKAWFADNQTEVCFELATPQTVQLSPTTVRMLVGNNTLWANSGDSELQYWATQA